MKDIVLIKGNRFGLNIHMDGEVAFEEIVEAFSKKLTEGRKFFGSSTVSIDFDGRQLSREQEQVMVNLIHNNTDMEVFCVVDENMAVVRPGDLNQEVEKEVVTETVVEKVVEKVVETIIPKEAAVFHQGTLRSGQELNVDSGIVIIGDVNPGAKVTAAGNVIVIGSLKGYAHAGNGGSDGACVFALNMQPTQIRISRVIARSPDRFQAGKTNPQIAYLEDNRIVIEEIHNSLYKDFTFLN